MSARSVLLALRNQLADEFTLKLREFRPLVGRGTVVTLSVRVIRDAIGVDEFHRIARQSEQGLIGLEGISRHGLPCLLERRRGVLLEAGAGPALERAGCIP